VRNVQANFIYEGWRWRVVGRPWDTYEDNIEHENQTSGPMQCRIFIEELSYN
jgi:hypothetical protein